MARPDTYTSHTTTTIIIKKMIKLKIPAMREKKGVWVGGWGLFQNKRRNREDRITEHRI